MAYVPLSSFVFHMLITSACSMSAISPSLVTFTSALRCRSSCLLGGVMHLSASAIRCLPFRMLRALTCLGGVTSLVSDGDSILSGLCTRCFFLILVFLMSCPLQLFGVLLVSGVQAACIFLSSSPLLLRFMTIRSEPFLSALSSSAF